MPGLISKLKYQYKDLIINSGIFQLNSLVKYYYYSYFLKTKIVTVRIKKKGYHNIDFNIRCRNGIDRNVLSYVFYQEFHLTDSEYLHKKNPVILDLGSNIGCTIVDLKLRYPGAIIFGYEMDTHNYNLAVANCRQFTDVHLFNKAAWIKKGIIGYNNNEQTDAYSISNSSGDSNREVECLSIPDIIMENDIRQIDFLKMDIEGAEINILNEINLSWLDKVMSLNIEFHHVSELEIASYIQLLVKKGFTIWKSEKHWSAIEGVRE